MQSERLFAEGRRILLCVHQFFPYFSAGTEVLTLSTARALKIRGYTVEIITAKLEATESIKVSSYTYEEMTIHQLHIPFAAGRMSGNKLLEEYDNPSVYTPFIKLLDKLKPDLVHFFHLKNLTTSALKACFDKSIPTVYTPTDYWLSCRSCQLVKPWGSNECNGPKLLAGNCLKHVAINQRHGATQAVLKATPQLVFSSLIIAASALTYTPFKKSVSPLTALSKRSKAITEALTKVDRMLPPTLFIENLLLNSGIPKNKIRRLRYGIQSPNSCPKEFTTPTPAEKNTRIGFIGTLTEHKGCHVFMQAIKLLPHAEIDFVIYGDRQQYPAYVSFLESIIQKDKRVRFAGTFPHEKIGDILNSLDALVIPSTWRENAPLVLLNALACGTPVIASDVTGITEYLGEGDNVTVFPPGNARQLALVIESHLALINDRAHNQGKGRIAGEPLDAYISALSGVYAEIINSHE